MRVRSALETVENKLWSNARVSIRPLKTEADLIYYIDKDHQGKGYGKNAAEAAIQILKAASPEMPIKLATEKGNEKARRLYTSLGFRLLPELDGDNLVFGL